MASKAHGVLVAILLAALPAGCYPVEFHFGGAPPPPRTQDPYERCVWENRISVRPATASYSTSDTHTLTSDISVTVVTSHAYKGRTFYRGRTRLTAEQALKLLGDEDLLSAYGGLYMSAGRKAAFRRKVAIGLAVAGTVVGLAGTGMMLGGALAENRGDLVEDPLFWSGLGVVAAGTILVSVAGGLFSAAGRDAQREKTYRTIFVEPDLEPQLEQAVARYNARVEARCAERYGRTGPTVAPPAGPRPSRPSPPPPPPPELPPPEEAARPNPN